MQVGNNKMIKYTLSHKGSRYLLFLVESLKSVVATTNSKTNYLFSKLAFLLTLITVCDSRLCPLKL